MTVRAWLAHALRRDNRGLMSVVLDKPTLWQRIWPLVRGYDLLLLLAVGILCCIGLVAMYSSGFDHGTRFVDHGRNMLLAAGILLVVSQVPPQRLAALAVPIYVLAVGLLVMVALFGITKKGAQRWVNVGVVIQPSELSKIAVPLMLAWWFQWRDGMPRWPTFLGAFGLLMLPVGLIMKQPDLGTALLVMGAGLAVIFFAGLPWRLVLPPLLIGVVGIAAIVMSEEKICADGVRWPVLHEYQQQRVCTLLDPRRDPLNKGFHTLQGMIAIGSGGLHGKGFMQGTQTPRAHHRLHLRRLFRGVRPRRQPDPDRGLPVPGVPRVDDRRALQHRVRPAARGRHGDHVLHLRFRQHGHGQRHPARGGRAAAVRELWRHRHGHAGPGPGPAHVHRARPRTQAAFVAVANWRSIVRKTADFRLIHGYEWLF
jgi:hypothetical protein